MKIERTKNASRNMFFGSILKIYQLLVPFVMRTAMIYFLGVQYLGLNSLFSSVLQVLNLAELGVGSAMVYSMYKPIADDDTDTICALMRLYKIYYRIIGLVVCVAGLILLPFIPYLIKGEVPPDINVYILYVLNLGATVLSYWLFAYKNSILQAHQRTDMISKVMLVTETVKYILQFVILAIFHNYYLFVIVLLLSQVLTNIFTAFVANRMYPQYQAKGKLPREEIQQINRRIRDLFTSKIGAVIVNSADTIVISAFLGLNVLAVYQNYFYVITAVIGMITIIFASVTAGIGNSIVVETKEKNFNDLRKFTFIIAWIAGICTSCFLCLFQPFMRLWVGKDLLLDYSIVICLGIYFFIYELNQLLNTYKDAAGIWHEDRFRPLVTALTNLTLNLISVQFIGLYGVVLSTVLSMLFVGMPWLLHNLFTTLFDKKYLVPYLKKLVRYVIVVFISCVITFPVCSLFHLPDILLIVVRLACCCIIPNIIFFLAYRNMEEFKLSVQLADKMTKEKIRLLKKIGA
ncbi:oligosaccharide flippase family protein [Acetivibrio thermocellus]|uniref:lipopolysaccharide biosynthesis protein n=1 Tax=Acetivibrio thermocellus TaxID=1515 RepID=UPI0021ADD444|nr:oligosaccharide flippase family protein [Acetivibrio thermocellus]UWV47809.1 oligosaccharide flippase family protein [Acetivibrio thermocellus]